MFVFDEICNTIMGKLHSWMILSFSRISIQFCIHSWLRMRFRKAQYLTLTTQIIPQKCNFSPRKKERERKGWSEELGVHLKPIDCSKYSQKKLAKMWDRKELGWGGRAQIDWGWTEDDRQEKEGKIVLASFPFQIFLLSQIGKQG